MKKSTNILSKTVDLQLYLTKGWHSCFAVNVAKFLITPFLQNTSGWLLFTRKITFSYGYGIRWVDKNLDAFEEFIGLYKLSNIKSNTLVASS